MKKTLFAIFAGIAILSLASCSDEEDSPIEPAGQEYDDAYYAGLASISSSDSNFSPTDNGGSIAFRTEGGSVVINVNCGTEWTVENNASDLFNAEVNTADGKLTVTAGQNTEERELSGSIRLITATQRIEFATVMVTQNAYGAPEITVSATEWYAPAAGTLTTEINVDATDDWYVVSVSETWITAEKTATGVSITVQENEEKERTGEVVVACSDGIRVVTATITVTQEGRVEITLGQERISFLPEGGTVSVSVETTAEWDFSFDTSVGWLTVERDGEALDITVLENTDDVREATVTVTASDGAENTTTTQLTVVQHSSSTLILVYKTTRSRTEVKLPLAGTLNCTVDWGDGEVETLTTGNSSPSHTYSTAGEYYVCVNGTVTTLSSSGLTSSSSPNTTLTKVVNWGSTGLTSMYYAFYYHSSLESLPADGAEAFADVTTFEFAFYSCTALTSIPSGIFDHCTGVTSFYGTFYNCPLLESIPDGLFDHCSEVTTFNRLFNGCTNLTYVPSKLFANCPKVEQFGYVLRNCSNLKSIPEDIFENCSNVESFDWAFSRCTSLETIPEKLFADCSKATVFDYCFNGCSALTSIPEGLFTGCPEMETIEAIFNTCRALTSIPAGLFANNAKLKNAGTCFYFCTGLTEIPARLFANCTALEDPYFTFGYCSALTTIGENLFENCSNITNFECTFCSCDVLQEIPEGLFDYCTKATNFYQCFAGCSSVTKIPDNLFKYCTAATSFEGCFSGCLITEVPKGLFDNCPNVENFRSTFSMCTSLKTVPENIFEKNLKADNFYGTFSMCVAWEGESPYNLLNEEKIHLYERASHTSDLNCVAPTTVFGCFANCTKLTDYADIPSDWQGIE